LTPVILYNAHTLITTMNFVLMILPMPRFVSYTACLSTVLALLVNIRVMVAFTKLPTSGMCLDSVIFPTHVSTSRTCPITTLICLLYRQIQLRRGRRNNSMRMLCFYWRYGDLLQHQWQGASLVFYNTYAMISDGMCL
jgi:hypothetical protein